ncbi:MAG: hypothetical protein E7Z76_05410 [Methanobrevibacter sp.]|jgi:hypothetical protein|nr:hypothetical protein [Methanobrevibacter sp.]
MNKYTYCKNCGKILSSNNFEICDECKRNHNLALFLKNIKDFLGNDAFFDENDFEIMGVDEFTGYEYIWDLSKLNLINLHDDKFFIDSDKIDEFIEKHYLSQYDDSSKISVNETNEEDYEVYDSSKVKIQNNPNYRKDIMYLAENVYFTIEEPEIPFPQANDLNRFIFLSQHLFERDLNKQEIKRLIGVHDRLVNMYTGVGLYFKIYDKYRSNGKVFYCLNEKGNSIFRLNEYDRNMSICYCILEHEIFNEVFFDCISNNEIKTSNIVDIMLTYELNLNSMVTIKRRANTVSSWMHWIFDLINSGDTNQTKLFFSKY